MICRDCGRSFDPKKKLYKGGFINQCSSCARATGDADQKYIGKPGLTNKDASIEIFRSNLPFVRSVIKRENRIGMTANIPISSPGEVAAQESWAARLRGEED